MFELSNLSIALKEKIIISNLSLSIKPGYLHVLMGPNGSGKSTLAQALMGSPMYTVATGSIVLNKEDITDFSIEKRARSGLFLASQQQPSIPGVQVFTFLREAYRMLVGTDLSVSEFTDLVYKIFDLVKLDHSFLYRNLYEGFSGGEKKRLEVVQLLLFSPSVALLDEIDSGVDMEALKDIAQSINNARAENEKLAILLITHYRRIVDYLEPDAIHVLYKGSLIKSSDTSIIKEIEAKGYSGLSL